MCQLIFPCILDLWGKSVKNQTSPCPLSFFHPSEVLCIFLIVKVVNLDEIAEDGKKRDFGAVRKNNL